MLVDCGPVVLIVSHVPDRALAIERHTAHTLQEHCKWGQYHPARIFGEYLQAANVFTRGTSHCNRRVDETLTVLPDIQRTGTVNHKISPSTINGLGLHGSWVRVWPTRRCCDDPVAAGWMRQLSPATERSSRQQRLCNRINTYTDGNSS
jgi:hypothetical protein